MLMNRHRCYYNFGHRIYIFYQKQIDLDHPYYASLHLAFTILENKRRSFSYSLFVFHILLHCFTIIYVFLIIVLPSSIELIIKLRFSLKLSWSLLLFVMLNLLQHLVFLCMYTFRGWLSNFLLCHCHSF